MVDIITNQFAQWWAIWVLFAFFVTVIVAWYNFIKELIKSNDLRLDEIHISHKEERQKMDELHRNDVERMFIRITEQGKSFQASVDKCIEQTTKVATIMDSFKK